MNAQKIFLVAIVLAVMLATVSAVSATDIYVPSPGNETIQQAVNNASGGDTIYVAAGTYNENVNIPAGKDNLEIIGNSKDDTFLTVDGGIGFDCYSPVTIRGFDISGAGRGSGHAFKLRGGSAGTETNPGVFEDNRVHDLNYGMTTGDYMPRPEYWNIKNNEFYELRIGVLLEHTYHVEITGNTFDDYKEGITMGYDADTARYITITDNEFLGSGGYADDLAAIVISSAATDIQVLSNEIKNSIVGVLIKQKDDTVPDLTDVNINCNDIVGNTEGVKNEAINDVVVNAENNWWGDASGPSGVGPGTGDAVSDNVDYDPWLPRSSEFGCPPPPPPVPALTPIGLIALIGLLSIIAAMSISISIKKRRR